MRQTERDSPDLTLKKDDLFDIDLFSTPLIQQFFRKANARFLPYIISVPKETSEIMASASGSDSNSKKDPNDL